jgi:hypothetical protein
VSLADRSRLTQCEEYSGSEAAIIHVVNKGGRGKEWARDVETDLAAKPQKVCPL